MDFEEKGSQSWVPLCAVADVEADCGKRVVIDDQPPVAVFRLGEEFCVTADTCSHGAASLCEGYVEDGQVECPWHAGKFDIRSGEATAFPAVEPIRVFRSCVRDGVVHVIFATTE
jgi:nitrite reductase/ring-hydroxylating ferredoxin subunit